MPEPFPHTIISVKLQSHLHMSMFCHAAFTPYPDMQGSPLLRISLPRPTTSPLLSVPDALKHPFMSSNDKLMMFHFIYTHKKNMRLCLGVCFQMGHYVWTSTQTLTSIPFSTFFLWKVCSTSSPVLLKIIALHRRYVRTLIFFPQRYRCIWLHCQWAQCVDCWWARLEVLQ